MNYVTEGYSEYLTRSPYVDIGVESPISVTQVPVFTASEVAVSMPPKSITIDKIIINKIGINDYVSSNDFTSGSVGWRIHGNGDAELNNVVVRGEVEATTGNIGDWIITEQGIYSDGTGTPYIKTSETVGLGSTGIILDRDGLRGYDSVLGKVFDLPTDGSAPEFSSGVISQSIFEINTNAVLRTSETVGDGTASSAGVLINNTGLYACEANQTPSTANIRILNDGTATISASIKGGQTDYNTGTGFFLGKTGGDYKFSIGDPTGNYLTWDDSYLRLKGNIELSTVLTMISFAVADLPIAPTTAGFNNPSGVE